MEEAKNILKEIRVDWGDSLDDSFNPLKLALRVSANPAVHKDFHKLFYKLEQTMSSVISKNYQAFCDASATFGKYRDSNSTIINEYEELIKTIPRLKLFQDIPGEEKALETNTDNGIMAKHDICVKIVEAKNTFKRFLTEADTGRKTASIIRVLNILESPEITQIKGAFEYYKMVFKRYLEFVDVISKRLLDFIVKNEIENAQCLNIIVDLQALDRFDRFCVKNFRNAVFRLIEDIIQNTSRSTPETIEQMYGLTAGGLINLLCKNIATATETILENTEYVIEKCKGFLKQGKNKSFFEDKNAEQSFLSSMEMCLEDLKNVLRQFLERYSLEHGESALFDINQIPDTFDYRNVFSENSQAFKRLSETPVSQTEAPRIFTLITFTSPETISKLIDHLKNKEIKDYLYRKVELRYLSGDAIDEKICKVQSLITEITANSEKISGETGEILVGNTPAVVEIGRYIDSCIAEEEKSKVISWARKCALVSFLHLYDQLFTSDFIKKLDLVGLIQSVYQHYGYVKDGNSGYIYFSEAGEAEEFKIPNKASFYILPIDGFKSNLIKKQIKKADVFVERKRFVRVKALIDVLSFLQERLKSPEMDFLHDIYRLSATRQVLLDFFYYFDLLYREGSYFHYLKLCNGCLENYKILGVESMKDLEGCLDFYSKGNLSSIRVKKMGDLEKFIDAMVVFSNVLDRNVDISGVIVFFKEIREGNPKTSQGRVLLEKIN